MVARRTCSIYRLIDLIVCVGTGAKEDGAGEGKNASFRRHLRCIDGFVFHI